MTVRRLFLLDGLGALLTAGLLSTVLAPWESVFGMPKATVYGLAVVAAVFGVYSLACALAVPRQWKTLLRIIAVANLGYCVVTASLLWVHRDQVTPWGWAYFCGEIMVILVLSTIERRFAGRE